jgi:hypothetical protein
MMPRMVKKGLLQRRRSRQGARTIIVRQDGTQMVVSLRPGPVRLLV